MSYRRVDRWGHAAHRGRDTSREGGWDTTSAEEASESQRGKWAARLLRSDPDICLSVSYSGRTTAEHTTENMVRSQPSAPCPDDAAHLPAFVQPKKSNRAQEDKHTGEMKSGGSGRVEWKEKLWGGFKNGHILNDRSKLRPTGLENGTHKFRTLNMFHSFLLPSLFSPSLTFFTSAGEKKRGTHTHFTVGCHIF